MSRNATLSVRAIVTATPAVPHSYTVPVRVGKNVRVGKVTFNGRNSAEVTAFGPNGSAATLVFARSTIERARARCTPPLDFTGRLPE